MTKILPLVACGALLLAGTPAAATAAYNVIVYTNTLNQSDGTFSGVVNVISTPCLNNNYNINISVHNYKDPEDAKKQAKPQIDAIVDRIQHDFDHCPSH